MTAYTLYSRYKLSLNSPNMVRASIDDADLLEIANTTIA